jgi:hypothetical protein
LPAMTCHDMGVKPVFPVALSGHNSRASPWERQACCRLRVFGELIRRQRRDRSRETRRIEAW